MKSFVMDFGQQHMIFIYAGVASQDFSELSYVGRLVYADADFHLPRLLRRVEDIYVEIYLAMILRHWH